MAETVMASRGRSSRLAALLICAVFALPITGWLVPGNGVTPMILRELLFWVMTVALVAYVVVIEKLPLSSVGWRAPSLSSAGFGFLGAVVAFAGMAALYLYVIPHIDPAYGAKSTALTALPFALKAEIVLRAAIFEELFYRGFMIERLSSILRWRWLAAAISWAVFTAAHLSYWGWGSVLIAGFGGLVLTLLYLWRCDLSSNMIAHALTDGVALFL